MKTNRSSARLNATQAIYEYSFGDKKIEQIVDEFLTNQIGQQVLLENEDLETEEFLPILPADKELFISIMDCFSEKQNEIEELIDNSFTDNWSKNRTEATLKAILQAGTAELMAFNDKQTPTPIVIKEYIELAASFYSGVEIKVVNGVLDNVAKLVRK
ncbi:MAG: transcription antitermination factor NusB [Alphaproteobacteria bacterium]|nr:transcription antitermination factor NusB [Alphaproteobacteria bacterium]